MAVAVQKKRQHRPLPGQKRNAVATRERVLRAALAEFCEKGYGGARTAAIAARAKCNIRMLYHYFGNKEGIYLAALEHVYAQLRAEEEKLDLLHLDPIEGMAALVEFTFDHMLAHREFIKMIGIENIQQGRFLRRSKVVPQRAMPLVKSIESLVRQGQERGLFRMNIDPVQLYISILSLSYVHISNRYTLSITFGQDLSDKAWLAARRDHVRDIILGYLHA
ncbi:MAG: TetR family transcriptional regulator [Hyphomicrobiaceae bacterium]|nr:TetR family transcriptional regulator [Hyphomicrobiaceae bacterium]